ncbi:MAG: hypothetical protein J6K55_12850 [Clostridia bacterium]|nr:hypothetical protein [Clostridia bacterium]
MSVADNKKSFVTPTYEVVSFSVDDVVTTSGDWGGGIMPIDAYEDSN